MLFNKAIKQTDVKTSFFEIVSQKFAIKIDVDYIFQHRYRSKAISVYFQKEAMFSVMMTYFFMTINDKYRNSFQGPRSYVQKRNTDGDGIYDYASFNNTNKNFTDYN